MQIGTYLPSYGVDGTLSTRAILETARHAEQLGLQHVWTGDHLVWGSAIVSPFTTLSAVAAVTEKVRLGTGVYLINLRPPAVTAKDVSSLDFLSGGRVILGIGAGGDYPIEYEAVDLPVSARGSRLEDTLTAVRGLLGNDGKPHDGEFVRHPEITMTPSPVQSPLPIWIGGRTDRVIRRAASMGQGWFPVYVTPERVLRAHDIVAEYRDLTLFRFGLNIFGRIDTSRVAAFETLWKHLGERYNLPRHDFERFAAFGTSGQITEFLLPYVDAGVTDIAFNLAGDDLLNQLDHLVTEVLPNLGWTPEA